MPSGGKNWLVAVEHDVTLLKQALALMPAPTPEHGLEAFTDYLKQVRELIHEEEAKFATVEGYAVTGVRDMEQPHQGNAVAESMSSDVAGTTVADEQAGSQEQNESGTVQDALSSVPTLHSAISDPLAAITAAPDKGGDGDVNPAEQAEESGNPLDADAYRLEGSSKDHDVRPGESQPPNIDLQFKGDEDTRALLCTGDQPDTLG